MVRAAALTLLAGCTETRQEAAPTANKAAEIEALARNLSAQADAWRDETDNQEAAAAAAQAATPLARPTPAKTGDPATRP
jgi:hypothetical protein